MSDVGAMGVKEMMGAPGAMWKCRLWMDGSDVKTMGIMAWPGEIRELGHSEGSECGYL